MPSPTATEWSSPSRGRSTTRTESLPANRRLLLRRRRPASTHSVGRLRLVARAAGGHNVLFQERRTKNTGARPDNAVPHPRDASCQHADFDRLRRAPGRGPKPRTGSAPESACIGVLSRSTPLVYSAVTASASIPSKKEPMASASQGPNGNTHHDPPRGDHTSDGRSTDWHPHLRVRPSAWNGRRRAAETGCGRRCR